MAQPWATILSDWWVEVMHNFVDEMDKSYVFWNKLLKNMVSVGNYIEVFEFIQFVFRHDYCPLDFPESINEALKKGRAAYRVFDKRTIFPVVDEIDAFVYQRALDDAGEQGMHGVRAHLRSAGSFLTSGCWADSIRESIHAIESAIKFIEPSASTLSAGLVRLEKSGQLNPNFKRAMNALYDYTSDEAGIRHAKVLDGANVNESDAIYMLGVCSAFVTFINLRISEKFS